MREACVILIAIALPSCGPRAPEPVAPSSARPAAVAPEPARPELPPPESARPASVPLAQTEAPPAPDMVRPREPAEPSPACGTERWDVKIGIDDAASAVDLAAPRETTIAKLRAKPKPTHVPSDMPRDHDTERTVFVLRNVHLTLYKQETGDHGDRDFHLVVQDAQHRSLVVEGRVPTWPVLTAEPGSARLDGRGARATESPMRIGANRSRPRVLGTPSRYVSA